jgi:Fe-S-cluster containining protein
MSKIQIIQNNTQNEQYHPKATDSNFDEHILKLADQARDSLGNYCMSTCLALCCKSGSLTITKEEALIFEHKDKEERKDGLFTIPLKPHCVHLNTKSFGCSVYDKRPTPCRSFPIYIRGSGENTTILIAEWCEGQKAGLLKSYEEKFKALGCRVIII